MTETMKRAKYALAFVVAAILALAMAVPAWAADDNTVKVTSTVKDETYSIYQMMELSVSSAANGTNDGYTAYAYKVASEWTAFFTTGAGKDYVDINDQGYVTWKTNKQSAEDMEAFSKAAASYANGKARAAEDIKSTGSDITFTGLKNGYYLITSTLGTRAMAETTPDLPNAEINEKNQADTITKTVQEDSTSQFGASNDAQIGDTVNFKSAITLVKNTRNVQVVDTMDTGLTYTTGSVEIATLTKGNQYTVTESANGFTISFTADYLNSLTDASTNLTLTYAATLNTNAVSAMPAIVGQKNHIVLSYGDKQTLTQETTTTTHKFSVHKQAGNDTTLLAGAVFQLLKGASTDPIKLTKIDDNNYKVDPNGTVTEFTTNATAEIVIWGVDADNDYKLKETTPPAGYNALATPQDVAVSADNTYVATVINNTGTELPSTGGMGTTILYIVGGIMVVIAAVVLITKRRIRD